MTRKQTISKINKWLKKHVMTYADIGGECPITKASDEELLYVLDDIADEQAAEQYQRYQEEESLAYMSDEEC